LLLLFSLLFRSPVAFSQVRMRVIFLISFVSLSPAVRVSAVFLFLASPFLCLMSFVLRLRTV